MKVVVPLEVTSGSRLQGRGWAGDGNESGIGEGIYTQEEQFKVL